MIIFILKLLILIYLLYAIRKIYDMIQYNENAALIVIDNPNKDKLETELDKKCPLYLKGNTNIELTIDNMKYLIPGYIINDSGTLLSLEKLCESPIINILKNNKLIEDFKLKDTCSKLNECITNVFSCGKEYYLSLLRGDYTSNLLKNFREKLLLSSFQGSLTIYIFNPKHEKEIKGNEITNIKKWGIKINLEKNDSLYIPPEWYYFYETKEDVILANLECDSYSTYLYNYLRKK